MLVRTSTAQMNGESTQIDKHLTHIANAAAAASLSFSGFYAGQLAVGRSVFYSVIHFFLSLFILTS